MSEFTLSCYGLVPFRIFNEKYDTKKRTLLEAVGSARAILRILTQLYEKRYQSVATSDLFDDAENQNITFLENELKKYNEYVNVNVNANANANANSCEEKTEGGEVNTNVRNMQIMSAVGASASPEETEFQHPRVIDKFNVGQNSGFAVSASYWSAAKCASNTAGAEYRSGSQLKLPNTSENTKETEVEPGKMQPFTANGAAAAGANANADADVCAYPLMDSNYSYSSCIYKYSSYSDTSDADTKSEADAAMNENPNQQHLQPQPSTLTNMLSDDERDQPQPQPQQLLMTILARRDANIDDEVDDGDDNHDNNSCRGHQHFQHRDVDLHFMQCAEDVSASQWRQRRRRHRRKYGRRMQREQCQACTPVCSDSQTEIDEDGGAAADINEDGYEHCGVEGIKMPDLGSESESESTLATTEENNGNGNGNPKNTDILNKNILFAGTKIAVDVDHRLPTDYSFGGLQYAYSFSSSSSSSSSSCSADGVYTGNVNENGNCINDEDADPLSMCDHIAIMGSIFDNVTAGAGEGEHHGNGDCAQSLGTRQAQQRQQARQQIKSMPKMITKKKCSQRGSNEHDANSALHVFDIDAAAPAPATPEPEPEPFYLHWIITELLLFSYPLAVSTTDAMLECNNKTEAEVNFNALSKVIRECPWLEIQDTYHCRYVRISNTFLLNVQFNNANHDHNSNSSAVDDCDSNDNNCTLLSYLCALRKRVVQQKIAFIMARMHPGGIYYDSLPQFFDIHLAGMRITHQDQINIKEVCDINDECPNAILTLKKEWLMAFVDDDEDEQRRRGGRPVGGGGGGGELGKHRQKKLLEKYETHKYSDNIININCRRDNDAFVKRLLSYDSMMACTLHEGDTIHGYRNKDLILQWKRNWNLVLDINNPYIAQLLDELRDPNVFSIRKCSKLGIRSRNKYHKDIVWFQECVKRIRRIELDDQTRRIVVHQRQRRYANDRISSSSSGGVHNENSNGNENDNVGGYGYYSSNNRINHPSRYRKNHHNNNNNNMHANDGHRRIRHNNNNHDDQQSSPPLSYDFRNVRKGAGKQLCHRQQQRYARHNNNYHSPPNYGNGNGNGSHNYDCNYNCNDNSSWQCRHSHPRAYKPGQYLSYHNVNV